MRKMTCLAGLLAVLSCTTAAVVATTEPPKANTKPLKLSRVGEMSTERAVHQATLLAAGQVLVTGGCADGCDAVHDSVERYDPATRSFRTMAPMTTPRVSHVAIALADGRVLVAGGWTGQGATATAETYDPTTGRFTAVGSMTETRGSPTATVLPDDRILIAGGQRNPRTPLDSAEIFDPVTSIFSTVNPMQTPRMSHAAVALADGRVLITGGSRARGEVLRSAEIYDPATGKFQRTGDMAHPRHKHAAALLADGRVLVIGGSDARDRQRGRYRSTELYDPGTGAFSPGPDMRWPRYKLPDAVAVLPSGAVLVAGGAARLELHDPAAGTFEPVHGELSGPREFATATLFANGEVLVLGGYDEQIRSSASAWLVRMPH